MLSWVGMGYGRQPTPGLCQEETRLVPSEACCRLPDSGTSFDFEPSFFESVVHNWVN